MFAIFGILTALQIRIDSYVAVQQKHEEASLSARILFVWYRLPRFIHIIAFFLMSLPMEWFVERHVFSIEQLLRNAHIPSAN